MVSNLWLAGTSRKTKYPTFLLIYVWCFQVQLYHTDDEDIFSGVVVAAKRKDSSHVVYLVFVID
jgi:hypothetical protein